MFLNLVLWYLAIALVGWLAFPLAYRLLAFLPDRGLALARPLGLLLWGYAYWLLVSFGVLQNDGGGVLFALLLVAALSLWRLWKGDGREIVRWLREKGRLVLVTELLFLGLFAFMALVRAANPDATGTEKPMELAFINSILHSPVFPPADPWLSGYSISYYYFGYVMVAALARISGAPGAVGFNLALASWFAMTGLGAYGLLYNLLASRGRQIGEKIESIIAPLIAPLLVLVVSNLEGFLEVLHAGKLFWTTGADGQLTSSFWQWLNIQELTAPPAPPFNWIPNRPGGIWWWRASRVLQDFALDGSSREIIDEFPAFSYVLGDLHPHVLSMPFVLLAVGLALNIYLRLRDSGETVLRLEQWPRTLEFWLAALSLGGLAFLNTWDFPIYLALFAAAVVLARLAWTGWRWGLILTFLEVAVSLALAGVVLYLPFYLGFASQANGILPSLVFYTRGVYFWIMFGALLLPVVTWLIWLFFQWRKAGRTPDLLTGVFIAAALVLGLWLLSVLDGVRLLRSEPGLLGIWGAKDLAPLIQAAVSERVAAPGTWLSLLGILALAWALIQANRCLIADDMVLEEAVDETTKESGQPLPISRADPFVLLLIVLGTGLVLFPEFFYLRDQFGWRMNTIFKFYFQAWVVWAIAAGYASVVLLRELAGDKLRAAFAGGLSVLLAMALVYPFFGFSSRTGNFNLQNLSLNGAYSMAKYSPDEMEAIQWLEQAPYGVVAEAVGGSYTGYARVSTESGLPTVLGWPGHESQWRGGEKEKGSRETDIAQLYKARNWDQASQILQKYNVRYVYLGDLERSTYRANDSLFQKYLKPVFRNGTVTIYEVPGYNSLEGQAVQP